MPHPKSTTTLSVVLALPILASGMASLNAQLRRALPARLVGRPQQPREMRMGVQD
jgi:hypothetical protein